MSRFSEAFKALTGQNNGPEIKEKKKARLTGSLDITPEDRVKMEMRQLRQAVENAVYPTNPDRRDLLAIYKNAVTDPQVLSQIETAKAKVTSEPFMLSINEKDDEEKTALLKKPWFESFLKIIVDAQMWGHTVVEFGPIKDSTFTYSKVFPRRHIEPFTHQVLLRPGDRTGIPYGDKPEAFYLIEIGEPEDLGLLQVISREVIWKNFSRSDWSTASEKFGMPMLYVKTGTTDEKDLDRIEEMCRNFASNGYLIVTTDDEVNLLESAKSDIFKIYEMNARFCDEQISKIINGQTGTSDEKAFVGSAEVHERILNDYHDARLRMITNIINYSLIPFLVYHGFPLEGTAFRFPALDPKKPEAVPDPNTIPPDPDPVATLKKKRVAGSLTLPSWVISMPEE